MNSLCSVLAVSLVLYLSEACIVFPTPSTPTPAPPTTTKAPSPTTTKAPVYKCPIGGSASPGITCVGSGNLLETVNKVANPIDCNTKCKDFKDSKCKFWSFVATRKICFLLSSCEEEGKKEEKGTVSGQLGCIVPSKSFTVINLIDSELTDCKAKWKPTEICPEQNIGKDGTTTIPKGGSSKVTYFTEPPSIGCTEITEATCTFGTEKCIIKDVKVPIPGVLYVKTTLADPKKCEIASTPKYIAG